jgi:hypothetical protein
MKSNQALASFINANFGLTVEQRAQALLDLVSNVERKRLDRVCGVDAG